MALSLPCPKCKKKGRLIDLGTLMLCSACGWTTTVEESEKTEDSTYIEDGGLKDDLNDLVRQAQTNILKLVLSQLPILDWNKSGSVTMDEMDNYLQGLIMDIEDKEL